VLPLILNVRDPAIQSLKDFKDEHRIALPAVKVSMQAIILQMAAAKEFGDANFQKLDHLTVSLAHPDATAMMLGGKGEVVANFSSSPFQYRQQKQAGIRQMFTSEEVLGGPVSFNMVATTAKFRDENPKLYKSFLSALQEATDFINKDKGAAAEIYLKLSSDKTPEGGDRRADVEARRALHARALRARQVRRVHGEDRLAQEPAEGLARRDAVSGGEVARVANGEWRMECSQRPIDALFAIPTLTRSCPTDLTFDLDFPVGAGACVAVSPLVRRIVADNPGPYTFTGNLQLRRRPRPGRDRRSGPGPRPAHVEALLAAVRGETVTHILVSHTHRDHSPASARAQGRDRGGDRRLQRPSQRPRAEPGREPTPRGERRPRLRARPRARRGRRGRGAGLAHSRRSRRRGTLANHLCFALPQERALFSADHVMAWATSFIGPPDGAMSDFMASLDKLRRRDETIYWPAMAAR
jgi:glyoxylase-like metal-dependent hydrolase (beta-lactamase superfamily II)